VSKNHSVMNTDNDLAFDTTMSIPIHFTTTRAERGWRVAPDGPRVPVAPPRDVQPVPLAGLFLRPPPPEGEGGGEGVQAATHRPRVGRSSSLQWEGEGVSGGQL